MFGISDNPLTLLFSLISLVLAIAVHEFAHALAADRLGDPTPRLMGRLTLNPLAHLDPLGSIMLLLVHFGWGKPVIFDPFNLRNPRRDSAIISLAGPLTNFLMAIVGSVLLRLLISARFISLSSQPFGIAIDVFSALLESIIIFNISLGVFNLVPIHPLDGFKIVEGMLPDEYARQWHQLEPYGTIFLLFLAFPILGNVAPISRIISPIMSVLLNLLIPGAAII